MIGVNGLEEPDADGEVPVTDMDGEVPATNMDGEVPVTDTDGEVPVTDMDGEVPATDMDGEVPATDMDGEVPVTDTDGEVPATGWGESESTLGRFADKIRSGSNYVNKISSGTSIGATVLQIPGYVGKLPQIAAKLADFGKNHKTLAKFLPFLFKENKLPKFLGQTVPHKLGNSFLAPLLNSSAAKGVASVAGKIGPWLTAITGATSLASGGITLKKNWGGYTAMKDFAKNMGKRKDLAGGDLLLHDVAVQGRKEFARDNTQATGKLVTGAMDSASAALLMTGVGAPISVLLGLLSFAGKRGLSIADSIQKTGLKEKMVKQTTGLTEDAIKDFQKKKNIASYDRAKEAFMRARGYITGTQAELYADQTEKRGEELARLANSDPTGTGKAAGLIKGMGLKKGENGYSGGDVAKRLGLWKSRSSILDEYDPILAWVRENERENAG